MMSGTAAGRCFFRPVFSCVCVWMECAYMCFVDLLRRNDLLPCFSRYTVIFWFLSTLHSAAPAALHAYTITHTYTSTHSHNGTTDGPLEAHARMQHDEQLFTLRAQPYHTHTRAHTHSNTRLSTYGRTNTRAYNDHTIYHCRPMRFVLSCPVFSQGFPSTSSS